MAKQCCEDVREILAAFLDDELPPDASHETQEHLDECAGCQSYARFEKGFSSAMRARLPRMQAPDALAARVLMRMDGADRVTFPWYRRRWIGLAAAAAIVLLILPASPTVRTTWMSLTGQGAGAGAEHGHSISGVLVCFECEKQGVSIEAQRSCRAQGHQTGLRCPQTGLWHLVANDVSADLMADPALRGRHVVLESETLDTIRYLDVRTVSFSSGT